MSNLTDGSNHVDSQESDRCPLGYFGLQTL